LSEFLNLPVSLFSWTLHAEIIARTHITVTSSPKETNMKEWLKPEITESEAGMEVTSYLPAELDRA
jgi:coenzyme PQQ precursor peptide PqqA